MLRNSSAFTDDNIGNLIQDSAFMIRDFNRNQINVNEQRFL
jgi:hypothetical protein